MIPYFGYTSVFGHSLARIFLSVLTRINKHVIRYNIKEHFDQRFVQRPIKII